MARRLYVSDLSDTRNALDRGSQYHHAPDLRDSGCTDRHTDLFCYSVLWILGSCDCLQEAPELCETEAEEKTATQGHQFLIQTKAKLLDGSFG